MRDVDILFVGAYPEPAALERYVSGDLALRIKALGQRIHITSRSKGRLARILNIGLDTFHYSKRCKVACVDVFSGPAFVWAELACAWLRRAGTPYILTLHGGGLPEFARCNPSRVTKLLKFARAVTCPSPFLAENMKPFCPGLILIPNGFDSSAYRHRKPNRDLREIVWLRAFHKIYNPAMAVEALAEVREKAPMCLTMVGPDKLDGSLDHTKAVIARHNLQACVRMTGAVPKADVPGVLDRGDVFINTTNFDNTPVSVMEAMAVGLPVVSTNVGGLPYLLRDNFDALLVPPDDPKAMAQALLKLIENPSIPESLSMNARAKVEAFDWGQVLPAWLTLLTSSSQENRNG